MPKGRLLHFPYGQVAGAIADWGSGPSASYLVLSNKIIGLVDAANPGLRFDRLTRGQISRMIAKWSVSIRRLNCYILADRLHKAFEKRNPKRKISW